jgi:hypothetical protein
LRSLTSIRRMTPARNRTVVFFRILGKNEKLTGVRTLSTFRSARLGSLSGVRSAEGRERVA